METKSNNKQRTRQEMYSLLNLWKASGISQQSFCKEHQISYSVFQYWLKKLRKEDCDQTAAFMEVKISSAAASSAELEIVFPTGARVIFKTPPAPSFIRNLVY